MSSDERLGRFREDLQVIPIEKAGSRAFRVVDPTRSVTWELWELEHAVLTHAADKLPELLRARVDLARLVRVRLVMGSL